MSKVTPWKTSASATLDVGGDCLGLLDDGFDGLFLEVWRVAGFPQNSPDGNPHLFSAVIKLPPVCPRIFADGFYQHCGNHPELFISHYFESTGVVCQSVVECDFLFR